MKIIPSTIAMVSVFLVSAIQCAPIQSPSEGVQLWKRVGITVTCSGGSDGALVACCIHTIELEKY